MGIQREGGNREGQGRAKLWKVMAETKLPFIKKDDDHSDFV